MSRRHDPHWKGGVDFPRGCEADPDTCTRCGSETQELSGICLECRDDANEVLCGICGQWGKGIKDETDACYECLNEAHAEANRIDEERRYLESA